jgi:hypothetical protein
MMGIPTIEIMVIIAWWFFCMWGYRVLVIILIGKGAGNLVNRTMDSLGGKRTQKQPESERSEAGFFDSNGETPVDDEVSNHC